MRTTPHLTMCLLGVLAALVSLSACATKPLTAPQGRVLEEGTNRPVSEAIVVGLWYGSVTHVVEGRTVCYHVESTTSDAAGTYRLPSTEKEHKYQDGDHYILVTAYKAGYERSPNDRSLYDERLKPSPASPGERLEYLTRLASATRCSESGASEKQLVSLRRGLYAEAKEIAVSSADKDKVETLLFGLESLEFGSMEALKRMSERREGKK